MNVALSTRIRQFGLTTRRLVGLLLVLPAMLLGHAATAQTLKDVTYVSLPGDRVQIRLDFSETVKQPPLSFTIDNPSRLALDFPGAQMGLDKKKHPIGVGAAQALTAVEAGDRTRVVLNMTKLVPYEVKTAGNTVTVLVENGISKTPAYVTQPAPVRETAVKAEVKDAKPAEKTHKPYIVNVGPQISNIDFRRGTQGEGRVLIALSDPTLNPDIREEGDKIIVDFQGTHLPENLDRKLDVTDFATPVQEVDTYPHAGGTRMVITPIGSDHDHMAYQSDDQLTIEFKPMSKKEKEAAKKAKFGYTGEKLSLNFQDIEVRAVLQLLADFTGLNMVASDTVEGNVTLRLKNVPWDQALDIILKAKGLSMRQNGNVMMVAPTEEIAAREKLELEAQQQLEELAPIKTQFIQINYAKAEDIAALLKDENNNLLSERGNVSLDQRTNTLLVQDTAAKLEEMRNVIATLDIPVRQVLIESRIVIADEDFAKDLGVQFGLSGNSFDDGVNDGSDGVAIGGRRGGDTNVGVTSFNTEGLENYIVNLPVTGENIGSIGLALGKIGSHLLHLELSALQTEGRGEVISSPRVITANQKEALIEQGTEIPYQEATSSGATSISFKKAVLGLRVTPQITPDDRIIMDLAVNKDAVGEIFLNVPSIDTQKVETQVLVDNGETVVLGGVFEQTQRNEVNRVPFFGELPYVGTLFRNTHVENNKTELLIFVTPKILEDSLSLR